jgi:hypothetical protein
MLVTTAAADSAVATKAALLKSDARRFLNIVAIVVCPPEMRPVGRDWSIEIAWADPPRNNHVGTSHMLG